uniref:Uncharacterized protein n=1 Tax=uncultured marine bacterium Ant39E11 TaxID=360427 RepID=Q2PY42_9BACT|nr:hypothetical protein [uncultured marine bacterium Ant39E11]
MLLKWLKQAIVTSKQVMKKPAERSAGFFVQSM